MDIMSTLATFLNYELFATDGMSFTVGRLLGIIISVVGLAVALRLLKRWILARVSHFERSRRGTLNAVLNFAHYSLLLIGSVIVLQAGGVNLSALTVLTGAVGIGVGIGLQGITNNLLSGIIILFERPIKVGDRIDVGEVAGEVVEISVRATTVLTNDNIAVIVPNSDFITQKVINWSFNDRSVRFEVPVGVSYNSDPRAVEAALLAAAENHDGVLNKPEPAVLFTGFGDSSLNFSLRVWTAQFSDRPKVLISQLNFRIFDELKSRGIEIPFPQMDVHLKGKPS